MTGTLRVTPEELMSTANSFSATAGTVQNLTGQMISTIDSLSGIWEGDGATAYYTKAHGLQDSINKMIRMIQEHSTDLQDMAKTYQSAESSVQETAGALQTDIIV